MTRAPTTSSSRTVGRSSSTRSRSSAAEPEAPWAAYRQFCEHFLAPLALIAHRDPRCRLMLRANLDGIPLDLAARLLPGRTRFNLGLGPHIHAHARAQRQYADRPDAAASSTVRMSPLKQAALLDSLRRTIDGLHWEPTGTEWADYADHTSYSDDAARAKDDLVRGMLEAAGGSVVWDLGANTGRFSRIAASLGCRVVAWDIDPAATEIHYRTVRRDGHDHHPAAPGRHRPAEPGAGLGAGRTEIDARAGRRGRRPRAGPRPSPGDRTERATRPDRRSCSPDLGPDLIVEFVPREDAMVERLLATREDVFERLHARMGSAPRSVAGSISRRRDPIDGTSRTLFRMRRRA